MTRDEMITALEKYCRENDADLSLMFDEIDRKMWTVECTQYIPPSRHAEAFEESLEEALSKVIVELGLLTPQDTEVVIPGIAKQPLPNPLSIEDTVSIVNAMGPLEGDKRKHLLLDLDWENDKIYVSLHTQPSPPVEVQGYPDRNFTTSVATVTGDFMVNPHPQADTPEPEDAGYSESNLPPHLRDAIAQLEQDGGIEAASRPAPGDRPSGGGTVFKERQDGF